MQAEAPIESVRSSSFKIPTDQPESDGTLEWDSTTMVLVEVEAGGERGLGYTYGHRAASVLVSDLLRHVVEGKDALSIREAWVAMFRAVRNHGQVGLCAMAISAVDAALWDLKARLLGIPLVQLLGSVRDSVPIYGSGGFTSYTEEKLQAQLAGWVNEGIESVKMKVGREPSADLARVRVARRAIGDSAALFVDANGAYRREQALDFATKYGEFRVSWFEEPVRSDDLEGLRVLRDRAPEGMEVAAGEYGYDLPYFRRIIESDAVHVLQPDAGRCGGITGFLDVAALCQTASVPLSSHTSHSLHLHACCACSAVRHMEYFHDHVRIEQMLFEGAAKPIEGSLRPDLSRPGLGLELKRQDAARYAA